MVTTNEPNVYETGVLDSNAEGNFVYTTLDAAINWIRKNSLWPMPMGLSCCAIEFMAVACSRYDLSRFGSEVTRFSPRQADVMIVAGTVTYKMALAVRRIWDQMPEPKWCIAMARAPPPAACSAPIPCSRAWTRLFPWTFTFPAALPARRPSWKPCLPSARSWIPSSPHARSSRRRNRAKPMPPCRSRRKCLSNKPFPTVLLRSIFYHFFSMPSLESQIKTAADNAQNRFGKDVITDRYEFRGDITLTVARHAVADVVRWLRDSAGFDMMVNLCSVDNMGESPRFEVNYTLTQAETGVNLSLKTKVDDGEEVPSVTEIFQSANWHEREVWDLMGIKFSGHPDLRRILMWEGYPYFPLRKDFPGSGRTY